MTALSRCCDRSTVRNGGAFLTLKGDPVFPPHHLVPALAQSPRKPPKLAKRILYRNSRFLRPRCQNGDSLAWTDPGGADTFLRIEPTRTPTAEECMLAFISSSATIGLILRAPTLIGIKDRNLCGRYRKRISSHSQRSASCNGGAELKRGHRRMVESQTRMRMAVSPIGQNARLLGRGDYVSAYQKKAMPADRLG